MKLNVFGIISLICGIIGMLLACVAIGIFPAIAGMIFAIVAFCQKNTKYGTAIAGMICSVIGIGIFSLMCFFATISSIEDTKENKNTQTTPSSVVESSVNGSEESTGQVQELESIEEVLETEEEYKASCQEYKYKDVLRNPKDYVGKRVKITVEISSVHEESWLNDTKYYFGRSDEDGNGYFTDNRYGIFDKRQDKSLKLLEDDVITVYGEIIDPEYTSSLIVTSTELFCIDMKYLDFISE